MGDKIKRMVIILTVIGLIASLICFFIGNAAYQEDKDYIEYCSAYGGNTYGYSILRECGDSAYDGLQLRRYSIVCFCSLIICAFPLYGFGVLVDCNEQQVYHLTTLANEQRKTNEKLEILIKQTKENT